MKKTLLIFAAIFIATQLFSQDAEKITITYTHGDLFSKYGNVNALSILNNDPSGKNIGPESSTRIIDIKNMQTQLKKLNNEFTAIRKQNGILAKKLIEDHDIGFLGANRPKSVQRIITGASKRAGRCFEILSGAPLTQKEMEAKNGKAFNRECPWLWPGNTVTE